MGGGTMTPAIGSSANEGASGGPDRAEGTMGIHEKATGEGLPEQAGLRPGLRDLLEAYERSLILDALAACGGHQRRTAARLGILPTTLHEKMKRLGLLKRRARGGEVEVHAAGTRDLGYSSMSALPEEGASRAR